MVAGGGSPREPQEILRKRGTVYKNKKWAARKQAIAAERGIMLEDPDPDRPRRVRKVQSMADVDDDWGSTAKTATPKHQGEKKPRKAPAAAAPKGGRPKKRKKRSDDDSEDNDDDDDDDDTSYSVSTARYDGPSRRSGRERKALNTGFVPANTSNLDPFGIVGTTSFTLGQPFTIQISEEALILMDLHAHMLEIEIIGYMAGMFDTEAKVLRVMRAFPGKSLVSGHEHVELDPSSEVEVKEQVTAAGLEIVGWYHSHPTFIAEPSVRDIENQCNYQAYHPFTYPQDRSPLLHLPRPHPLSFWRLG